MVQVFGAIADWALDLALVRGAHLCLRNVVMATSADRLGSWRAREAVPGAGRGGRLARPNCRAVWSVKRL